MLRTPAAPSAMVLLTVLACSSRGEAEPDRPVSGSSMVVTPPSRAPSAAPALGRDEAPNGPNKAALPPKNEVFLRAEVRSTLEAAVIKGAGAEVGPALSQVLKRALVWWVNPRTDLWKGDQVEAVYETRADAEPVVHAVWFHSTKLDRDFSAVYFKPRGAAHSRWYQPDGSELELALENSPILEYEQITALLRDGRGHRGVDFKAPVGTPIYAPFAGTVQRVNWSRRANGNCVDIETRGGRRIFLLHLDRVDATIRPGVRVRAGQQIGLSGNTGRSTAPHLHYQMQQGPRGRVLDPFRVHETHRRKLSEAQAKHMRARMAALAKQRSRSR